MKRANNFPIRPGRSDSIIRALVLMVLLPVAACSTQGPYQLNLMPAPEVYSEADIDPFSDEKAGQSFPYDGILYATDRQPANGTSKEVFYENERGHLLRLGVGKIQLGKGTFSWEEARRISLLKNRGRDYPLRVVNTRELGVLDSSRSGLFGTGSSRKIPSADKSYASLINKKLASSQSRDIYIYIHGYKVVFSNPLLVAMELWHFLGYDGVFIAYSWPATPSPWAYAKDLETAAYSSRNLRLLLEYLARETSAHRIHIIAYSAGTRVAIDTLAQLALMNSGKTSVAIATSLRVGNVILLGSDSDRDIFSGYLEDGLLNMSEKMTIYMSDTDKALGISRFLFTRRRLGQVFSSQELGPETIDYLRRTRELVVIDVSNAENAAAGNGHDYFRKSPWVSSDILMTLKHGLAPQDRGIVRDQRLPVWSFPDDYVERLRRKLKKLYGDE